VRVKLIALLAMHGSAGVCALPAAEAGGPAPPAVTVMLSDYRFSPDHLVFRRGASYRLLLENHGKELHEFTAPAFFHAVTLGTPEVLGPGGDVVLRPGERKELRFVASAAGRYALSCADHDWAGMTGDITIE
jgi:uncharacterized cupredoxin-like copper-binding protein